MWSFCATCLQSMLSLAMAQMIIVNTHPRYSLPDLALALARDVPPVLLERLELAGEAQGCLDSQVAFALSRRFRIMLSTDSGLRRHMVISL